LVSAWISSVRCVAAAIETLLAALGQVFSLHLDSARDQTLVQAAKAVVITAK
jgi:hypothetical protein